MPSRPPVIPIVLVNGAPDPTLRALTITRSAGGQVLDTATYELDLAARGSRLANILLSSGAGGALVEISAIIDGSLVLLHSGMALLSSIELGSSIEKAKVTSRLEKWHFGIQLTGMLVFEPLSQQLVVVPEDPIFNRMIDDAVLGNMSEQWWLFGLAPVFLDQESVRTEFAMQVQQNQDAQFWTVQSAAAYLCWSLNPDETYVKNPIDFSFLPTWTINDFTLPRGQFLPDYLDLLLNPFGLSWYVDLSSGAPQIAFFARGLGVPVQLYLGPPGSVAAGFDQVAETTLEWNLGNTRNQINVWGDYHYVESTFILTPAWERSLDSTLEDFLAKDSAEYQSDDTYRDVWRKWTLNEAGDYSDAIYVGAQPYPYSAGAPYDLEAVFGHPVAPRRRVFLPTITLGEDGAPIGETAGIDVEYSLDGGTTWLAIAELADRTCLLLDRECGIRFDGLTPPPEIASPNFTAGNEGALVRVTATLRDDYRLAYSLGPDGSSPLAVTAPAFLDEGERFHWREVGPDSKYADGEDADGDPLPSSAVDDTVEMVLYAAWLYAIWNIADVGGQVSVEGFDNGLFDVGCIVTAINGRNIALNANVFGTAFPQIVQLTYDVQAQTRLLTLETFRSPGQLPPMSPLILARTKKMIEAAMGGKT